jgi:hypothetical protein
MPTHVIVVGAVFAGGACGNGLARGRGGRVDVQPDLLDPSTIDTPRIDWSAP